jgi:hypothetical protein
LLRSRGGHRPAADAFVSTGRKSDIRKWVTSPGASPPRGGRLVAHRLLVPVSVELSGADRPVDRIPADPEPARSRAPAASFLQAVSRTASASPVRSPGASGRAWRRQSALEWLPGASRASQPERDAGRQIFTGRIRPIYLTVNTWSPAARRTPHPRHVVQSDAHLLRQRRNVPVGEAGEDPDQQVMVTPFFT